MDFLCSLVHRKREGLTNSFPWLHLGADKSHFSRWIREGFFHVYALPGPSSVILADIVYIFTQFVRNIIHVHPFFRLFLKVAFLVRCTSTSIKPLFSCCHPLLSVISTHHSSSNHFLFLSPLSFPFQRKAPCWFPPPFRALLCPSLH